MKSYTWLSAILLAVSSTTYAQSTTDPAASVLWDQVAVTARDGATTVVVTARVEIPRGTTFDHPVYPQIESITTGETLGSGSPKSVTLPTADGDYTSDLLTWSFKPGSKWAAETASTMYCTMFYTPVPGTAGTKVSMGRVEVVRSGVTGIDDVTVGDTNPYTEVYTLTGVRIAAGVDVDLNALGRGVYIVRSAKGISKIVL